jgi:hypothetical protein
VRITATNYTRQVLETIKLDWTPVTCVRPIGQPSDEELTESLQRITGLLQDDQRKRQKSVMIVDMRHAGALKANQRRIASAWMKQNLQLYKHHVLGCVFIIDSPIVRGVLTALLWLQPLEMPHDVVATVNDAVRWAIEHLKAEGIAVPERLRSELAQVIAKR